MNHNKSSQDILWEVFLQKKSGQPFIHAGSIHAFDKEMALQNARDTYTRRGEATVIWVVPSHCITSSTPEDVGPFFEPANDKIYRHPTFYNIPDAIKNI